MNLFLLCILLTLSMATYAATNGGQHCTAITAAIERLACFDKVYNTPIYVTPVPLPAVSSAETVAKLIWQQEENRPENDYGLRIETMLEHTEAGQQRVIISAPALGTVGTRPILAASCIDNITRLQLILPQPTRANRIDVQLRGQDDTVIVNEVWRTSEQGHAVDVGRGIPSIKLLKQLLPNDRITVDSDETAINGIRFDIERLSKHIRHLQRACRWRGDSR